MGGLSLWHWLIVLVIVVLVFGTKRLKNVGEDLGEAVRGFKKGLHGDDAAPGDGRPADAARASAPQDAAATPSATTAADKPENRNPPNPPVVQ